jgi:hypothetical protein
MILFLTLAATALAESRPLPAIMPTQPAPDKPIAAYRVGDVLACNSVSDLPANHNYYADKRYNAGLKASRSETTCSSLARICSVAVLHIE